jgi:hypothetical protein
MIFLITGLTIAIKDHGRQSSKETPMTDTQFEHIIDEFRGAARLLHPAQNRGLRNPGFPSEAAMG